MHVFDDPQLSPGHPYKDKTRSTAPDSDNVDGHSGKHRSNQPQALVKKYHCDQCAHSTLYKSALRAHVAAVHDGKRFQCDQCIFSSSTKAFLK